MTTITATRTPHIPPRAKTPALVVAAIVGVSAAASLFLAWLVYYHQPTDVSGTHLAFLPALNATLNGLCTLFLLIGFSYIRKLNIVAHRNSMFGAFIVSSLFLVSYIVNHALHGDMHFLGQGHALRVGYFALLISHIGLSVVALPLILITFFLSLTGRFPAHRAVAKWTYPLWLYVSVTGVIVYAMLAAYK
jgi:putative membrane protein